MLPSFCQGRQEPIDGVVRSTSPGRAENLAVTSRRASFAALGLVCVFGNKLLNRFQRIDFTCFLVGPQSKDSGKAKRITTLVSLRFLDSVKGHFNYCLRLNYANSSVGEFLDCVLGKPLSHLR